LQKVARKSEKNEHGIIPLEQVLVHYTQSGLPFFFGCIKVWGQPCS